MRKYLILLCLLWGVQARAANAVYTAQTSAGANDGSSCANAKAVAYFNTAGSWSATPTGIQIGPGTTVHLCGTITSTLTFQGNGTAGNSITLFFETGAKLSQAFCGAGGGSSCLDASGKSWFVLDGGVPCGVNSSGIAISEATCNGIIEANANGTSLANQNGENSGITVNGATNFEIKNLDVRNIYVRTSTTDSHPDAGNNERPYAIDISGASNYSIHDGKAHDANWALTSITCSGNISNISIYNEDIYNDNHGVAFGLCHNSATTVTLYNDHFGSMVNWDDTTGNNQYHHDSFHGYVNYHDGGLTGLSIYSSTFDGNVGVTNTGFIFLEGPISGNYFNNFFLVDASQPKVPNPINNCNGSIDAGSNNKYIGLYNNTMMFLGTTDMGAPIQVCHGDTGTVDVRNNAVTLGLTTNANLATYHGGTPATWDYNAYGNNAPGTSLFSNSSSCCVFTYAQWKAAFPGFDAHSTAILTTPLGLDTSTGVPNLGSPVIAAGTNLSGLGITALNSDKNGNVRPATWTIGAFNSPGGGGGAPATPTNISVIVVGP